MQPLQFRRRLQPATVPTQAPTSATTAVPTQAPTRSEQDVESEKAAAANEETATTGIAIDHDGSRVCSSLLESAVRRLKNKSVCRPHDWDQRCCCCSCFNGRVCTLRFRGCSIVLAAALAVTNERFVWRPSASAYALCIDCLHSSLGRGSRSGSCGCPLHENHHELGCGQRN